MRASCIAVVLVLPFGCGGRAAGVQGAAGVEAAGEPILDSGDATGSDAASADAQNLASLDAPSSVADASFDGASAEADASFDSATLEGATADSASDGAPSCLGTV